MEERYIKIKSCKDCEFNGHITEKNLKYRFTFICSNPINDRNNNIPHTNLGGTNYPITSFGNNIHNNPIPTWCKLPSKVQDNSEEEINIIQDEV